MKLNPILIKWAVFRAVIIIKSLPANFSAEKVLSQDKVI
jgi:hypothetical protein